MRNFSKFNASNRDNYTQKVFWFFKNKEKSMCNVINFVVVRILFELHARDWNQCLLMKTSNICMNSASRCCVCVSIHAFRIALFVYGQNILFSCLLAKRSFRAIARNACVPKLAFHSFSLSFSLSSLSIHFFFILYACMYMWLHCIVMEWNRMNENVQLVLSLKEFVSFF